MISKKLFLADCIENFKRRDWVFWLQLLVFFFCFPGALLLGLNSITQSYSDNPDRLWEKSVRYTELTFDLNTWIGIVIVGLAILAGIQAFAWLHDKKQVDFYHSQPVSRNRRFLVIWINGILSFAVSYGINLLLGTAVAASYGCLSGEILAAVPKTALAYLLLFMAIYHVAIVAVMLTGHTLVSLIAVVVLLAYEVVIRALYCTFASAFFRTWSSMESVNNIEGTFFSPIPTFFRYSVGRHSSLYGVEKLTYTETMFTMTGLVFFFGLLGWLLYKARASESHGKSISFARIKEPLKVLLLVVLGLAGYLMIYGISGSSTVLGIGGAIFTIFLGHAVIQLIYEVDFRAIRKGLVSLAISIAILVFTYGAFRWDIFGYDDRIPSQAKVESVALSLARGHWDGNRILPDGTEVNTEEYWHAEMELTNLGMVYRLLDNRINKEQFSDYENLYRLEVVFNLKNGKTSYRNLYFSYQDNLEVMNEIFHTPEYQQTTNQVMEDDFFVNYRIFEADYEDGRMEYEVPADRLKQLAEAYVKDVNSTDFAQIYDTVPLGRLYLGGKGIQNKEFVNQWRVIIYPSFTNTIAVLEQCGIKAQAVCDQEYLDGIRRISIIYSEDEAKASAEDNRKHIVFLNKEAGDELSQDLYENVTAIYHEEPARLKEILDNAYLSQLIYWNHYGAQISADEIEVIVELYQPESYAVGKSTSFYHTYYFNEGKIPEFVQRAMEEASSK